MLDVGEPAGRGGVAGLLLLLWCAAFAVTAKAASALQASQAELVELRRVGGADEAYGALMHPVGAVEQAGMLYVADLGSRTVVGIDSQGRVTLQIGGEGEGPGEFRAPSYVGAFGDTIWISDVLLRRTTYFDLSGKLLDARAWSEEERSTSGVRYSVLPLATGSRLGLPQPAMGPSSFPGSSGAPPILLWGPQGRDTLARQRMRGAAMTVRLEGGGVTSARQPFPEIDPLVGYDPSGRSVVLVRASGADAREPAIEVVRLEPGADTLWVARLPYEPRQLTAATVDSAVDGIVRAWTERDRGVGRFPSRESLSQSVRDAIVPPDYYPPVTDVQVGHDGTVWLRREGVSAPTVEWTVVGADGELVWSIEMPRRSPPIAMAADHVWTVERDALDLPHLVLHGIRPANR